MWNTTDAVTPGGTPPGTYTYDGKDFVVGPDQIVKEPGKTNFAGSALRPIEGVFRAAEMLNCPWQDCWERYSAQPRALMKLDTDQLQPGKPADFCLIDMQNSTVQTHIRGAVVSTLPAKARLTGAG